MAPSDFASGVGSDGGALDASSGCAGSGSAGGASGAGGGGSGASTKEISSAEALDEPVAWSMEMVCKC